MFGCLPSCNVSATADGIHRSQRNPRSVSLMALLWLRSLSVATVISEVVSSLRSCHKD